MSDTGEELNNIGPSYKVEVADDGTKLYLESPPFRNYPDGIKLKLFPNSSQRWYRGVVNPVTGLEPTLTNRYVAR
jgi:hypothetical protein